MPMIDFEQLPREDSLLRRVDSEDGVEFVADLGPGHSDATVDVVDGTAIVMLGEEQYDLDLPEGDLEAFIRNGVLTISTEDS